MTDEQTIRAEFKDLRAAGELRNALSVARNNPSAFDWSGEYPDDFDDDECRELDQC